MRAALRLAALSVAIMGSLAISIAGNTPASAAEPEFEPADCPVAPPSGVPESAMECGYVTVPENRSKPDGTQVRLAVAIIKASQEPVREPILYLSGGPGGPSLQGEMYGFGAAPISAAFLDRDIIFYDQRGTGLSTPSLYCDEVEAFTLEVLKQGWSVEEAGDRYDQGLRACRARLLDEGVDLAQYSSAISADDIADLMTALGHDTFHLYGISYGTRLALTVMRDHPERVTSAVIDSVLPPNVEGALADGQTFTRSLNVLIDGCAADAECNAAYPDLEQTFWDLVASATADPFEITINDVDGNPVQISVDGNAIVQGAFTAFYSTDVIPLLPFAAYEIAAGNTAILTALAQQIVFAFSGTAVGMTTSVRCSEETPFYTEEKLAQALVGVRQEIIDAGIGITTPELLADSLALCDDWGTLPPPAIENQPVVSDIPTLVFAGQYDPVTPPEWGRLAAETLSTSYFFEFPATGHSVIGPHPACATGIVNAFFDDPQTPPDGSCVAAIPPPDFQVPAAAPTPLPPVPTPTAGAGTIAPPDAGAGQPRGDGVSALALLTTGVCATAAVAFGLRRMLA